MLGYLYHIGAAMWELLMHLVRSYILKIPMSYPGDPIPIKQYRTGNWSSQSLPVTGNWRVAVGAESHTISEKQTPGVSLTGEPAGRQIWYQEGNESFETIDEHTFNPNVNPNGSDLLFRDIMLSKWKGTKPSADAPTTAKEAAHKGMAFFQMLQTDDGHWAGDYGGPLFLLPGLIITLYLTKVPYPAGRREGMITYLRNHQQLDGGWGSHIECASTLFGTVLCYVALRLLGISDNEPFMVQGRDFLHLHGGALYAPSWAKFWLAVLGVYHWDGINSIPAEMWVLPKWVPLHPSQFWCHCRMIYLPMCYLYSKRFMPNVSNDPLLQALRRELYLPVDGVYEKIDWEAHRQSCSVIDEYTPLNPVIKVAQDILQLYEYILPYVPPLQWFRDYSLKFVIEYIHAEDLQTNYINIGPVSKCFNMLSVFDACGAESVPFQRHIARVDDYIWVAEDGVKMQGYNGSQCWDTSFTVRAMVEGGLATSFPECASKVYKFLSKSQIARNEENRERYYRHISKGGWPFSTAAHGWPISDCTSEALKGVLALHKQHALSLRAGEKEASSTVPLVPEEFRISDNRLCDACDVLLSYQNSDGGWASYENNRGSRWYELFNPSSVFGDIMIDYSYVECSAASMAALKDFTQTLPEYRQTEIKLAIQRGVGFIKSIQRKDGSWYGSWGNCFTYGTWFGIEGLISAGERPDSPAVQRAVQFLLSKQRRNGGWGESYLACINKEYPTEGTGEQLGDEGSGLVQTAWALLGLLAGECTDKQALLRAKQYLMDRQLPDGDWPQENITGIFARSSGITYTAYRNLFPMWALARYAIKVEQKDD
eukprot:gene13646-15698_t